MSQCTTKYCSDDDNDNDVGELTAMVSRLQNSLHELEKHHEDSIEQLQQQFNDPMEQQQEYVIKLENTMKEKISIFEQGTIYTVHNLHIGSRVFHAICF